MAVMENAEHSFTLSYTHRTDVCLVRLGSSEEPIPRLRYMYYSEVQRSPASYNCKRKDFFLDDNGQILIEQSSGNKFLRNISGQSWGAFHYAKLNRNIHAPTMEDFMDRIPNLAFSLDSIVSLPR